MLEYVLVFFRNLTVTLSMPAAEEVLRFSIMVAILSDSVITGYIGKKVTNWSCGKVGGNRARKRFDENII